MMNNIDGIIIEGDRVYSSKLRDRYCHCHRIF